jgi:coenzyme F420-reducing hydrogenase gamma subunit
MTASERRPRLGVFKLASCDGCQLTLLDCEDELLALSERLDIAYFAEATSRPDDGAPFDLVLVEGSVSAPSQVEEVRAVRARARFLVTIGACATAGGVQALRNYADAEAYRRVVYARPEYVATLATSTPVSSWVPVDFELRGCPIDKRQLLEVITAFLLGRRPQVPDESVCMECKRKGQVCVMVAHGEACLGPVTHAGCGALCPGYLRGCYGCFGPKEEANTASVAAWFAKLGVPERDVRRSFHHINNTAPAFAREGLRHDGDDDGD